MRRILVLDHFFAQDIEALRAGLPRDVELRTVRYEALRLAALEVLPDKVLSGLETLSDPVLAPAWERAAARVERVIRDEFAVFPFDAFVAPSDLFFYVRSLPEICHRLGAPFVVVQKETTVADVTLEEHAPEVRRHAPPVCDVMTACSARQREFWVRAGGDQDRILVTGQPRFDPLAAAAAQPPAGDRVALFFSYHLDAYHPSGAGGYEGTPAWRTLHEQTERGLVALAERGWRIVVKPHPQQSLGDWSWARRPGIRIAAPDEDARRLIAEANVVVGFQTTALFEALGAGRPVVYTGWDPEARALADRLIPFDRMRDVLTVVDSPDDLVRAVEAAAREEPDEQRRAAAARVVTEWLGPVDGHATERVLAVVLGAVEDHAAARTPEAQELRAALRRPAAVAAARVRRRVRDLRHRVRARLRRKRD